MGSSAEQRSPKPRAEGSNPSAPAICAVMAQSVEHVLGKDEVAGSIPANSSIKASAFRGSFFVIVIYLRECYTVKRKYWKEEEL